MEHAKYKHILASQVVDKNVGQTRYNKFSGLGNAAGPTAFGEFCQLFSFCLNGVIDSNGCRDAIACDVIEKSNPVIQGERRPNKLHNSPDSRRSASARTFAIVALASA